MSSNNQYLSSTSQSLPKKTRLKPRKENPKFPELAQNTDYTDEKYWRGKNETLKKIPTTHMWKSTGGEKKGD